MTGRENRRRNMERKSDKVRKFVAEGDYKSALRFAKDFRLGISKQDSDNMIRGFECMNYPSFYKSLGMDPSQIAQKAVETVQRLYGT